MTTAIFVDGGDHDDKVRFLNNSIHFFKKHFFLRVMGPYWKKMKKRHNSLVVDDDDKMRCACFFLLSCSHTNLCHYYKLIMHITGEFKKYHRSEAKWILLFVDEWVNKFHTKKMISKAKHNAPDKTF